MKHVVVSPVEWTYPDIFDYDSGSSDVKINVGRNGYATSQILLKGVSGGENFEVKFKDQLNSFNIKWYELVPVYVESNPGIKKEDAIVNYPNRWAPFYIYDCLKPLEDFVTPIGGIVGLYFSIEIPADASPGILNDEIQITLGVETINISVEIIIYSATVPVEENFKIINGYNSEMTAKYHDVVLGSSESKNLDLQYLKMLRHMRQNMLYVRGVKVDKDENGEYSFDFTEMIEFVEMAMSLGFKYFNAPSVGGRRSWKESTILIGPGIEAMSYEGYKYLSQYLPQLRNLLIGKGWIDNFYMGVSDEPNEQNATEFRALCGLVKKFIPEIKLIDAVSFGLIHGALDVWVPLNSEYDKYQKEFESYRNNGDELWHYVCCGPRGEGYINRFMDYPLLSTRYLFWGNYKYNLGGYLHWASNFYQPGQDPFTSNTPLHRNRDSSTILPSGDSHIIYPGQGEPWMSMRLEAHRESAEEYELLSLLSQTNKELADEICSSAFKSFNHVEYDPVKFLNIKTRLLEALSE